MPRFMLAFAFMLLTTLACSLSAERETPEPRVTMTSAFDNVSDDNDPSPTPRVTQTPRPTNTPQRVVSSGGTTACTPRSNWQLYTVAAGDTLGSIARRTGTTISELTTANCLRDPNSINTGQQLRVPVAPQPNTPVPSPTGSLDISPIVANVSGSFELQSGVTVTIRWWGAPTSSGGASFVDFYLTNPDGYTQLMNRDNNLNDGAAFNWIVPPALNGQVSALAYRTNGSVVSQTSNQGVFVRGSNPNQPVSTGYVAVDPYLYAEGGGYTLKTDETTRLSWPEAPRDSARVDFIVRNPDGSTDILGTDNTVMDGTSITWKVPRDLNGALSAIAYHANGTQQAISYAVQVFSVPFTGPHCGPLNPGVGDLSVSGGTPITTTCYQLQRGANVTISWPNGPIDSPDVTFYVIAYSGNPDVIGVDTNPADGISINWSVYNAGFSGQLYAMAASGSTTNSLSIYAE
jgi:LysM repeat protein